MRNLTNSRGINTQIKAGLQVCYKVLNKDKHPEKEYKLFTSLAELYLQKENVREYPKVAATYQYLKKLTEVHLNGDKEKLALIDQRIKAVESRLLEKLKIHKADSKSKEPEFASIDSYKEELVRFREGIKNELAAIEDLGIEKDKEELNEEGLQRRAQEVERIYLNIREFFIGKRDKEGELTDQGLVNKLINDCIRQLGGLPKVGNDKHEVEYAIFGMGSMALGTMTPWSDLEFGILIEEGLTQEDEKRVKEYFRNFTTLLYIKVINFGETPLRMVGIEELNNFKLQDKTDSEHNWFYDDFINPGFSFDGPHWHACKTPMGRVKGCQKVIEKEGIGKSIPCNPYELIGTINQLITFYGDRSWYKEDPQLVQAIGHIVLIVGHSILVETYQRRLVEHRALIESQAFEILKVDSQELSPFKQIFHEDKDGGILNVKKEVYRFPDRTIVALGDCLGGLGDSSWGVLQGLIMNEDCRKNLKLALSISTELRLRTYASNDGQREDVSALIRYKSQIEELRKDELTEQVFYLKDTRILYRYYYTVLPLAFIIEPTESIEELQVKCLGADLFMDTPIIKGFIYKRFMKYYDAIKELEKPNEEIDIKGALAGLYERVGQSDKALELYKQLLESKKSEHGETYNEDIASCLHDIGNALEALGRLEEALKYKKECLEIRMKMYKGDHANIAQSLNNIGFTLKSLGRFEGSLEYYRNSLEMFKRVYKGDHTDIATSLNNIGIILEALDRFEEALEHNKASLDIRRRIYKGDHYYVAASLNNLGAILHSLGKSEEALRYNKESLEMRRRIYKGDHPDISQSLNNTGNTLRSLGRFEEALEYLKESLEMNKKIYKGDHPNIVAPLNNIGNALQALGKYEEALEYHQACLDMRRGMYKGDHTDISTSLNNIGTTLDSLGRYEEALGYKKESLGMRKRIYKEDHTDISRALNNVGLSLHLLGRNEEALEYLKESWEMSRNIYKEDHATVATPLSSIGIVLHSLGEFEEALSYYKESLEMRRKIYKGDHADIAESLNNMGNTFESLGRYEEALECHQISLDMRRRIYKEDHVDIAASLNNIGNVLKALGRFEEALEYHQASLDIRRRVYKGDHADIATSLSNIGAVLTSLGKYEEALNHHQANLEMNKRIYKGDHLCITASFTHIGILLHSLDRLEEALEYHKASLDMKKRIYKVDHVDIAESFNDMGFILKSLERWEEAYGFSIQAKDMLIRLSSRDNTALERATSQIMICTIWLANKMILSGAIDEGFASYAAVGIELEKMRSIADTFLYKQELALAISCYEVLDEKLCPDDIIIKHNLACCYHIKALKERSKGKENNFEEHLYKAKVMFAKALSTGPEEGIKAALYTEYVMFLLKYYKVDDKKEREYKQMVHLISKAIKKSDDGSNLGYNQLEKPTVCEPIQELLNRRDEISIKPMILGYYLLIKVHAIHSNIELACKVLEEFKKQLQLLQTAQDFFIGYHLLEAAHKDIIAETVKEVSSTSTQLSVLPSNICNLIAEYEGSLSYDKALSFNREGATCFKGKHYNVAIVIFSKAIGLSFTTPISEVLYNRGRAYHESDSIVEAIADYKELLSINPNHVKAYYQLGICSKQRGNLLQAETYLKQALIRDPKLEIAQKALDEINQAMSGNITRVVQQQAIHQQSHQKY